jgi:hypothetical protein
VSLLVVKRGEQAFVVFIEQIVPDHPFDLKAVGHEAAAPTGAIQGSATSLNRHLYSPASTSSLVFVAQSRIAAISRAVGLRLWA